MKGWLGPENYFGFFFWAKVLLRPQKGGCIMGSSKLPADSNQAFLSKFFKKEFKLPFLACFFFTNLPAAQKVWSKRGLYKDKVMMVCPWGSQEIIITTIIKKDLKYCLLFEKLVHSKFTKSEIMKIILNLVALLLYRRTFILLCKFF